MYFHGLLSNGFTILKRGQALSCDYELLREGILLYYTQLLIGIQFAFVELN